MTVLLDQIHKAERKAEEIDIAAVVRDARDQTPLSLATPHELQERHQFLRDSLKDIVQADKFFERIMLGNELQDVNYLERGAVAARAVARIAIRRLNGSQTGWGTGFMIAPGVLLTNHHVLPDISWAQRSEAQFNAERDLEGRQQAAQVYTLEPQRLFYADEELDFAVVAVAPAALNAHSPLSAFGFLPLLSVTGKVSDGEWLSIIQHPNGELKQVCVRENKLVRRTDNELWYSTDTLGGSSGSPVFNNDWYVVALHHSGVAFKVNGVVQTVDGHDFDPRRDGEEKIRWIANEGIRVSRIVRRLHERLPAHTLLAPLFNATPATARIALPAKPLPSESDNMPTTATTPTARTIAVTLHIDLDGNVSLDGAAAPLESAFEASKKEIAPHFPFDVAFDASYADRKGFDEQFLGKRVALPRLSADLERHASPLLKPADGNNYVLHYHNMSVVMHARRRWAVYTAANVRYSQRYKMGRPSDVWRTDPRIAIEHQVSNFYYRANQFDRGHLTRREDMEYGSTAAAALASAADTCHWTNCTPQHSKFNQSKELWQGLEGYVLESGLLNGRFDVQVFTGPVLEEDDPVYKPFPTIQYPVRFWKVLAALDDAGKLFATAYLLDQSDVIAKYGIETTAPYGAYKTFQITVDEVERLTGLSFTGEQGGKMVALSTFDPLAGKKVRTRARSAFESSAAGAPGGYRELADFSDVVLPY